MTSALAPVSAVLPAPAQTAGAGSSTADGAAPGAFSQQLAQHRAAEQATDRAAQSASAAARRAAAPRSAASGAAANSASASAGRGAASAATEAQAAQAEASARKPAAAALAATASDAPPVADEDTSVASTVDELLVQLQGSDSLPALPPTSTAAAARAAALVDAAAEAPHEAGAAGAAGVQAHLLASQGAGNEATRDTATSNGAWTAATDDAADQGTAALQAQTPAAQAEAPAWSPVAAGVPGAASAQPTPGMPAAAAAAPLPEARLPAPPGHADFAPQLGAQISVFVREGLQQARLQLNPAEMGPITVQIRLDGGNAQVHLAAEHAATRQALEQAMPSLAGSLRDSGLTLTGGGVFEQPRQPGSDSQDPGRPTARSDSGSGRPGDGTDNGLALPPGPMGAPRRGVVDLVA